MNHIREPERQIPIRDEVDVLVVGGGTAGPAAAIAAGRHACKALLIERAGFLGGNVALRLAKGHTLQQVEHDEQADNSGASDTEGDGLVAAGEST